MTARSGAYHLSDCRFGAMGDHDTNEEGNGSDKALASLLRAHRDAILDRWVVEARAIRPAARLSDAALRDFLPPLLDRIADSVEAIRRGEPAPEEGGSAPGLRAHSERSAPGAHSEGSAPGPRAHSGGSAPGPRPEAEQHALDRIQEGFDLPDVVAELALLRTTTQSFLGELPTVEHQLLDRAIDEAIIGSVERFVATRDRTMRALDAISRSALESRSLDELLHRLARVLRDHAPAVDVVVIMLSDGQRLRVRAAVGLEEDEERGLSLAIGEGFAGRIAAEHARVSVRDASLEPLIRSEALRARGVRALYGVPLAEGDAPIGVAYMGSLTAFEFSDGDRFLLETMAARATAGILQHLLRDAAERRTREVSESQTVLRISEERARLAIEAADLGTWDWDVVAGTISLSERCRAMFGLPGSGPVTYEQLSALVPREERGPFDAAVRKALEAALGVLHRDQRFLRGTDRQERLVALRGRTIFDHADRPQRLIGAALDITEERLVQQRLRFIADASSVLAQSLECPETLQRLADLAVPQIADWCAIELAKEGEHDAGLAEIACAGGGSRPPAGPVEQAREASGRRAREPVIRAAIGGATVLEARLVDGRLRELGLDDEQRRWFREQKVRSLVAAPIARHGQPPTGVLFLAQSESGRHFTEADRPFVHEIAARIAVALENTRLHRETKRLVEARDVLLGIVSHDLRNPLGVIDMGARLLAGSAVVQGDAAALRQAEAIVRNSARMTRLIEDLLDVSSLERGRFAIDRARRPLAPVLMEAAEAISSAAAEKGVKVELSADVADVEAWIDRGRILQVVVNLLGNAIKFTERGGTITLDGHRERDELEVAIRDTGAGIAPDDLGRVFEPYWRKQGGGTGLGLFISRGIVEAHGGRIWVESHPGHGSTFFFRLPLTPPSPPTPPLAP